MQQETSIKAQVDVIYKATQIAIQSKEKAIQFLTDAGIMKKGNTIVTTTPEISK